MEKKVFSYSGWGGRGILEQAKQVILSDWSQAGSTHITENKKAWTMKGIKNLTWLHCNSRRLISPRFKLLTWHDRQINDVNLPLSFIIAPESKDLLHPSHFKHFLCHFEAMGPFFSSSMLTTRLHAGHFLDPPNCGSGRAREVKREEGLTSSDEMACANDTGNGTTFIVALLSSLNFASVHFLQ